jgi:hypothetical protein
MQLQLRKLIRQARDMLALAALVLSQDLSVLTTRTAWLRSTPSPSGGPGKCAG